MPDSTILVTKYRNETLFIAMHDAKPVYLSRMTQRTGGAIFTGRVENAVRNLNAAFVRYGEKETGYLPFSEVPAHALFNRPYEAGDALKNGDMLCVQMRHAARGTKQARLTGFLTLHGTMTVLGFEKRGVGCSKSIPADVRQPLLQAFKSLWTEKEESAHFGVILRTECGASFARCLSGGASVAEAAQAVAAQAMEEAASQLRAMSSMVREGTARAAGTELYRPDKGAQWKECLLRTYHFLQRAYPAAGTEIVCDTEETAATLQNQKIVADGALPVRVNPALFTVYGIENMLEALTHRVVWLKSGAYLVIDQTEAMTVVDVNSGKYIAKKDDDFLRVNLEAASELMRQIRLRDLSGIIVADFINMREGASAAALKEALTQAASCDPVHTTFHDITALGLAEITRSAHDS